MNDFKIIIAGPVGSGKTTAIETLSDEPPVNIKQNTIDVSGKIKSETTVTLDYGTMSLGSNDKVHIYGIPGQEGFSLVSHTLTPGEFGVLLLLDNTRPEPLDDMKFFLESLKQHDNKASVSIGITRTDVTPLLTMERYQQTLRQLGFNSAIFEVNTGDINDMSQLVQALLFTIDPGLEYSV